MTGVPRLLHLPVPAATAGARDVALPGTGGDQRVKAVTPVTPAQRDQSRAERSPGWQGHEPQKRIEDGTRRERDNTALRGHSGGEAAAGKLISFSRLTALPFMVQVLGQQTAASRGQPAALQTSLSGHRDAALLGSDVYRKAGGEPEFLPDSATFVRLAV
ncbi:MAG: hypothetical protein ACFCUT_06385 [Kiloniellaceae bacterium]